MTIKTAVVGQFAKAGGWESAWSFTPEALPSPTTIREYVRERTEIGFEVFFGAEFAGVRFEGQPEYVVESALRCVDLLSKVHDHSSFFDRLAQRFNWSGLGDSFEFAEVGAVNAWKSVGPFRLNLKADVHVDEIWAEMLHSPVGLNRSHAKAIEFGANRPTPHWVGLPVSGPQAPFELDLSLFASALDRFRIDS